MEHLDGSPFEIMMPFEVKSMNDGTLVLKGYASTFHDRDRQGDTIDPKAFDRSIEEYMRNPRLLAHHNPKMPIGYVAEATIDQKGLYVKGMVPDAPDDVTQEIRGQIQSGLLSNFSIGGYFYREKKGGMPHIYHVDLKEISVVSIPANPYASFTVEGAMQKGMEVKSMPAEMEYGSPVAFEAKTLEEEKKSMAGLDEIPTVHVLVEGPGMDKFMGYWYGTPTYGQKSHVLSIQAMDLDHLKHQLDRVHEYANRAGCVVQIDLPKKLQPWIG